jgi:hypothetical protein
VGYLHVLVLQGHDWRQHSGFDAAAVVVGVERNGKT